MARGDPGESSWNALATGGLDVKVGNWKAVAGAGVALARALTSLL